jgi:phage-related tail fiber protein
MPSWKDYVRAATTANVSPFPPTTLLTMDGVALNAGDRVLVKDQNDATQNGIWVAAAGSAWVRSADADTGALLTPESTIRVSEGGANALTEWVLATQGTITPGNDGPTILANLQQGHAVRGICLQRLGDGGRRHIFHQQQP